MHDEDTCTEVFKSELVTGPRRVANFYAFHQKPKTETSVFQLLLGLDKFRDYHWKEHQKCYQIDNNNKISNIGIKN